MSFLEAVAFCELTNRLLIVDWRDGVYAPKGDNSFHYFFKSPYVDPDMLPDLCITDNMTTFPISWRGGVSRYWRDLIPCIQWRIDDVERGDPLSYFVFEPDRIDYLEDVIVWMSWGFRWRILQPHRANFSPEWNRLTRDELKRKLLQKSLCLRDCVANKVELFANEFFIDPVLGVHVRYTDNLSKKFVAKRNVIIENYFNIIEEVFSKHGQMKIFLCTDNWHVTEIFFDRLGEFFEQ